MGRGFLEKLRLESPAFAPMSLREVVDGRVEDGGFAILPSLGLGSTLFR